MKVMKVINPADSSAVPQPQLSLSRCLVESSLSTLIVNKKARIKAEWYLKDRTTPGSRRDRQVPGPRVQKQTAEETVETTTADQVCCSQLKACLPV